MPSNDAFNPLDKTHLGESVAQRLMSQPEKALPLAERFKGAGVYALFYRGDFPAYQALKHLKKRGRDVPIYVGEAVPKGFRKGGQVMGAPPGTALYSRIRQHSNSIKATKNLNVADFRCRHLVVDDVWIPLGESMLIAQFRPIWNTVIDGFGNHTPGKGRFKQERSRWDVLHPGREWADRCANNRVTSDELVQMCAVHFQEL